jgi:hypothetical protein
MAALRRRSPDKSLLLVLEGRMGHPNVSAPHSQQPLTMRAKVRCASELLALGYLHSSGSITSGRVLVLYVATLENE